MKCMSLTIYDIKIRSDFFGIFEVEEICEEIIVTYQTSLKSKKLNKL